MNYRITHTSQSDLPFIFMVFEQAIAYQKEQNYTVWKGYDKDALRNDLKNRLQYKISWGGEILCVFSICYSDKVIWRKKENGDALYIHRMAVAPNHRGERHFTKVLRWAIEKARTKHLSYIRMDTWDDNPKIVKYYESFGFQFVEYFKTPNTPELPIQHRNLGLTLLQFDLNAGSGKSVMKDYINELDYIGLSARIKRLSDLLNSEARKVYAHLDFDIEPNWHLVFLALNEQSLSVTELAQQLKFSHPAVVRIIKKMKGRGYVQSGEDKDDSRRQILSLTAKSKKLLPRFEGEWDNIQKVLNDCTPHDFLKSIRFIEEKLSQKSLFERLQEVRSS